MDLSRGPGWLSPDPEVENGQEGLSPYAYNFGNAVRYSDPNGRLPGGPGDPRAQAIPLPVIEQLLEEAATALGLAGAAAVIGTWVGHHLPSAETLVESFQAGAGASGPLPGMVPGAYEVVG